MAKNEQCIICKGFNSNSGLCTIKWEQPIFDGVNCDKFQSTKNSEPETNDEKKDFVEDSSSSGIPSRSIIKRGKSIANRMVYVKGSSPVHQKKRNVEEEEHPEFVIQIPENVARVFYRLLLSILFVGIGYGIYYYIKDVEKQKREDLVWKARVELDIIKNDKTKEYLRLADVEYEDSVLRLSYIIRFHKSFSPIKHTSDSLIRLAFTSEVALFPDRWKTICKYLNEAQVKLAVTCLNDFSNPSFTLSSKKLASLLENKKLLFKGLKYFEGMKADEVLEYARIHFRNDRFLKVDGVVSGQQTLELHLSYDDSKARLGKSFLDTTKVSAHFTDPVGDMGSVLDGMLAISTRTDKGIAFVYKARKSQKVDSCVWDAEKTKELAKKYNGGLLLEGRKTNRVRTIITKHQ